MKIIDYIIVIGTNKTPLDGMVRRFLKDDYQPYGDPYLDRNGSENQAMVRYDGVMTPLHALTPESGKMEFEEKEKQARPKKGAKKNED